MPLSPAEYDHLAELYQQAHSRRTPLINTGPHPIRVDAIGEQPVAAAEHLRDLWTVGLDLGRMDQFPGPAQYGLGGRFVKRLLERLSPDTRYTLGKSYMKEVIGLAKGTWGDHWRLGVEMMDEAAWDLARYFAQPELDLGGARYVMALNAYALRRLPAVAGRASPIQRSYQLASPMGSGVLVAKR